MKHTCEEDARFFIACDMMVPSSVYENCEGCREEAREAAKA